VLWRKALTRPRVLEFLAQLKPLMIGIEACATAHYWAREIQKLLTPVRLSHSFVFQLLRSLLYLFLFCLEESSK
jgi:hypothetical protein